MTAVASILGQVLAVTGALVLLVAGVGTLRLADVYMRASSVATATGIGISLVILGALLSAPGVADTVKALLAVVLQVVTAAVAGLVLGRTAVLSGHRFRDDTRLPRSTEQRRRPEPEAHEPHVDGGIEEVR